MLVWFYIFAVYVTQSRYMQMGEKMNRIRTRYFTISTVLLAACASALCGNAIAADRNAALRITGVMAVVNDPFFITMKCGALAATKEAGAELSWQGPTSSDAVKQLQTFNSVSVSRPDGILTAPFLPQAFIDPIKKSMSNGVPVIVVDSELDEPAAFKTVRTTIGDSVAELARAAGKEIGGNGAVSVVAASPGSTIDQERYEAFLKIMADEFPGVRVLPVEYAKTDTAAAAKIANAQIVGNPDLKLIYTTNGPQAAGVISAVKAANKVGQIKVYSYDATPVQVDALRRGEFSGLLAQSPYLEGYEATKELLDYLKAHPGGGAVTPSEPQMKFTPMMLLTPANLDTAEAKKFLYVSSCDQ
jgi:ribose transport system substrate-binding protein